MEFQLKKENNCIHVSMIVDKNEVAKAICYFGNTPEENGERIGCIGEFTSTTIENGVLLLQECEKVLKKQNIHHVIAPMNGNTWKKYRTLKYTDGSNSFLLENVNPQSDNQIFQMAGYQELHTYTSTRGMIKDAYHSDILKLAEDGMQKENISIRKFQKNKYLDDLKKIFSVSKKSFIRNPFYTPIAEEEFIKQYESYISMVDEDLILIAEKEGKEIGFVFCIPNFNELKEIGRVKTLILKTIAVLPEYENMAIGNVLLDIISKVAIAKGFEEWIFAFMYRDNTSQKMAKRNNTHVIREYAIYGKEI